MATGYGRYIDWTAEVWSGRREYGPLLIPISELVAESRAATAAEREVRRRRVKALTTATRAYSYVPCWVPPERLKAACEMAHGIASRELGLHGVDLRFCRPAFHQAEKDRAIGAFDCAVNGFTRVGDSTIWINADRPAASAARCVSHELFHCARPGEDDAAAERYATQFWARHGRQIESRFGSALRAAA